jgi:inosine/xanthosine triphosphate pyrophosphatase family protein
MLEVTCATGNTLKFGIGQNVCLKYGIELIQAVVDIDEIQGEDPEKIVMRKAQDAYAALQKPVVVSDDSWAIPGLRGFPGAHMKSVNYWFTPEDFIRLTKDLVDRRIFLQQYLAYCDGTTTTMFSHDIPGTLLTEARGQSGDPAFKVVSLDADNGLTIAEVYDAGKEHYPERFAKRKDAWHGFAEWYVKQK